MRRATQRIQVEVHGEPASTVTVDEAEIERHVGDLARHQKEIEVHVRRPDPNLKNPDAHPATCPPKSAPA
ncbi:MAG: hypothetical protein IPN91_14280 [Holophagaceae bacterium]|uniref:Uncharacterized protein n=1 Tax=Candidatus Geothrix odensensis TaxID=2954440 RepID=A0A936F4R2_9BACT|nr:hypothetical protein [Candidatus Geothrix odensensis]